MAEIYEEYEPMMLHYAKSIMKHSESAEDAVHNAFLAIIKHKDTLFLLSRMDLRARIVIMVKNKCIDLLRQQNKIIYEPLDDVEYMLESKDTPIEDQIILNDEYETLLNHIGKLDEVSRLILEMKYILGMSYKEIGTELGMTPGYVDTKIQRAKKKARKMLAIGGNPHEK